MKDGKRREAKGPGNGRRQFLGLLGVVGAAGLSFPFLRDGQRPKELSFKEADFYRDHDLAG